MNKKCQLKNHFDERIVSISINNQYPFHLLVMTDKCFFLLDVRNWLCVISYLHIIPKQHIHQYIHSFVNENGLVIVLPSKKYSLIIPVVYDQTKHQFNLVQSVSSFQLPHTFPLNTHKDHFRIIGCYPIINKDGNELIMIVLDSDQRMILQQFVYGTIKNHQEIYSTMLPMEHSLERDIPEGRIQCLNIFKALQTKYKPKKHHSHKRKKKVNEKEIEIVNE